MLASGLLCSCCVRSLLRYHFWTVQLVGVMFVAALAANTATTLLGLYVLSSARASAELQDEDEPDDDETEDEASVAHASTSPADERARRAERTAERILGYNPMCPSCGPAPIPEPEADTDTTALSPDDAALRGAPRTALPLVVAATMESPDPTLSLATVVNTEQGIGGLFGVGDPLGPQIEIVGVTTGVVHIRNAGALEYIPFQGAPMPTPKAETKRPTAKPTKPADKPSNAIDGAEEAIQCGAAGDCVVERAFVERLLAEPRLLVGQGAASPATTQGGQSGFKLRSVRRGTLPDLLGLKNGDVITEVAGTPLSLDTVTGLFGKLRNASHIEVTIDRRGERMTRQVEIRS